MSYVIVNKNNNKLCGFFQNGLPVTSKGKFNSSKILEFKSNYYSIFGSEAECIENINYMKNEIYNNSNRYEKAFNGATDKLLKIVDELKIKLEI